MPGIHIRKASWIDWAQKGENASLEVPGSYWLCYKNSIYKFTFRYHRESRGIKQFQFARELMKVVRKIIKYPHSEGQQFRACHILVTFNHLSWTRQDRTFALAKFKERSVVAHSHAFLLTIKLSESSEKVQNLDCIIKSSNESLNCRDNNLKDICPKANLVDTSIDNSLRKNNQCSNAQEQILKTESKGVQPHNNVSSNNLNRMSISIESAKEATNNEGTNKIIKHLNASFKVFVSPEDKIELKDGIKDNNVSSLQTKNIKISGNENRLNETGKDFLKSDICFNDTKVLDNNSIVDDANLPYQYLIEKEIESVKRNIRRHRLERINGQGSAISAEKRSDVIETQDLPYPKKRKYMLDSAQRSSDITDLVMEGLMFTIRQDQDAVAVIEQQTKLEIDEVLENSEKIETAKGEKLLRNSSLLGLENLITMIELPKENKCQNAIDQRPASRNQSTSEQLSSDTNCSLTKNNSVIDLKCMQSQCSSNNFALASTSFSSDDSSRIVAKRQDSEIYVNYKSKLRTRFVQDKDSKCEEEGREKEEERKIEAKMEEEEDIIPEAFQNEIFQPFTSSVKMNTSKDKLMSNKDLLIDDVDEELMNKNSQPRMYLRSSYSNNKKVPTNSVVSTTRKSTNNLIDTMHQSKSMDSVRKSKLNKPTIFLNRRITLNEIPLPFWNIGVLRKYLLNKKNKINENTAEICRGQLCTEKSNSNNTQLQNQISDSNVATNTQYLKQYQNPIQNIETSNESELSELKEEVRDFTTAEGSLKLTEEQSQEVDDCTDKISELSWNETKDITKEFHEDISYLQEKRNLRSRKNTSCVLNNTNNGEMQIRMAKLLQDITMGAKVVIKRINM